MASFKIASSLLAAATLVAGHGYVTNATIGDTACKSFPRPRLTTTLGEKSLGSCFANSII